ncbi:MAG: hypothetical protein ACRD2A_19490, partial [Vicinamibacterales bacterium]
TMDRGGGLAGELLVDDRARDKLEVRTVRLGLQTARSHLFNDFPENGIGTLEMRERLSMHKTARGQEA